ncbi:prephenate dehydratase [Iningainema tapete]|uniref:Prephenate dehydratase n=1 Tax=Iningainema tapete BLCC-T55 TaxID=2748662 RepID=A0A8J6XFP7_9CYAN|nr:prephenate dehydratase [Iningainema tapete]MBD2774924.1 prephenate dehydratase [Iningainema tapete BLCC-T55]
MTTLIAHLGPPGTYAEQAANLYLNWLNKNSGLEAVLCPYPSIAQSLRAVAKDQAQLAVVPVENSIEGSVTMTLDTLWELDSLHIRQALIIPIAHTLISCAQSLEDVKIVYSHPQALAQCQRWLERFLPHVQLIPSNSTTESLLLLEQDLKVAAISSQRAAQLYNLPVLATGINDYAENRTRFLVVSKDAICRDVTCGDAINRVSTAPASHTSLAFSLPANVPGALVTPLQIFAKLGINLSKIESRPTKRSLGEYLFFIDAETDVNEAQMQSALSELRVHTEVLKIFGSYSVLPM